MIAESIGVSLKSLSLITLKWRLFAVVPYKADADYHHLLYRNETHLRPNQSKDSKTQLLVQCSC